MTDTLPPVIVIGQRMTAAGTYPSRPAAPSGSGGSPSEPGGVDQNELDPDAQPGGGEGDPCSDPATALDWNVDAAAAKAYAYFLKRGREEDNDTDGFLSRERHVYIYQRPDGSVYFGPLATGLQGQVQGDETGIAPDILIGSVHNHPGGTWAPSGTDWSNFDHITNWMTLHGQHARAQMYRIYVIGVDSSEGAPRLSIRVYDKNSSRAPEEFGLKVNPEGQPCPGITITPPQSSVL